MSKNSDLKKKNNYSQVHENFDNDGGGDDNGGSGGGDDDDKSCHKGSSESHASEAFLSKVPLKNHVSLSGHNKLVSAIGIDPSGTRMISGSYDYKVKFWDFSGMDETLQSFREIEPNENYPVSQLCFSLTGDKFVVATYAMQPKLYSRDGILVSEFKKGDHYLNDMSCTKGHTSSVTGLVWHPNAKQTLITSSMDSTVRIWDINTCTKSQVTVIKAKNAKGTRTSISACCYNTPGTYIGAACTDGSIQFWKSNGPFHKPHVSNRNAHVLNNNGNIEISSINISKDGNTIITRATDDTLKVWDKRKLNTVVKVFPNLPNVFSQTDCIFSPDDRFIVTGTSVQLIGNKNDSDRNLDGDDNDDDDNDSERGIRDSQENKSSSSSDLNSVNQEKAKLVFIDKKSLEIVKCHEVINGSIIRVNWHPILNQIFVGSADHKIHAFYNDPASQEHRKGITKSLQKRSKSKHIEDMYVPAPNIITPNALPLFKEQSRKRQREKAKRDPILSHTPAPPTKGPGHGGRLGDSTTHILIQELGVIRKKMDYEEDPREAILRYAEEAEKNPTFIAPAYKKTQPVPLFDYEGAQKELEQQELQEQIEEEERSAQNKFKRQRTQDSSKH